MIDFGFGEDNSEADCDVRYVVLQVVLTETVIGTKSSSISLIKLQNLINEQASKGYKLHTFSTTSSGAKGFFGGDKIQATMVFEKEI